MNWLHLKHSLLRTPLERPAQHLRVVAQLVTRMQHPELHELFLEERRIERILRHILRVDSNCIDAGSHIGSFLSLLMRIAPHGNHVAFEPVAEKARWIKQKFPEVDVHNLALGEKHETLKFYQNLSRPGFSGFGNHASRMDKVIALNVGCEMLDNVIRVDRRYEFLKIDVEGAELLVLKGSREMIARDTPMIFFESSHDGAEKLGLKRDDLFAFFVSELRYDVFLVKDYLENRPPLTIDEFQRAAIYPFQAFNFLAAHRLQYRPAGVR